MTTERERFDAWCRTTNSMPCEHKWIGWQAALSAPPDTVNRRAQPAAPADAAPSVAPEPVAWTTLIEIDWVKRNAGRAGSFYAVKAGPNDIPLFAHPPRAPLTEEQKRDLVKECDLDWQRGFMPLFDGDPTNRYAVLIEAVEAAHGIGGK